MAEIKAHSTRSTFRLTVSVSAIIIAEPAMVWELLTSVSAQREWNATLTSIDGAIADGRRVELVTVDAPDRTFKLAVNVVEPGRRMVWSDGMAPMFRGVRTFTLTPTPDGVRFGMQEVLSGLMLPLIAGSLPDFVPAFETYARTLKAAAEAQGDADEHR